MSRAFYGRALTKPAMKSSMFSGQSVRQLLYRISARVRAWRERKAAHPFVAPTYLHFPPPYAASIHRDVTPNGVRVYSLCSDCGSRLTASATLCDECAQKRSRPARPY
jgi:hypothetical protein